MGGISDNEVESYSGDEVEDLIKSAIVLVGIFSGTIGFVVGVIIERHFWS